MATSKSHPAAGLGTFAGVFTPSVLTILGLILFSRMGYIVGSAGLGQVLIIIALANSVSVLTSASLSAIATNLRVKSGGDYYLISRSLGVEFGGALGVVLFSAQAISVAFYCIGFGEALAPLLPEDSIWSVKAISGAAVGFLFLFAWLGSDWATRLQYVVMTALVAGLASFFIGGVGDFSTETLRANWAARSADAPGFWVLFALFFPAVTGFTQGVSMSGDLKDPGRSLPTGTFAAVGVSLLVYFAAALVFSGALPNAELADGYGAMGEVAIVPWLVLAGVIAATLSSALASFMGAPRILQAVAADDVFPLLRPFAAGSGALNNPRRGVLLTLVISLLCVALANVDLIAPVVTMFFLMSYGLLNYATALEARAASPSFRPRFRFFHYRASLVGAVLCLGGMLMVNPVASGAAIAVLFALYQYIDRLARPDRWADSRRSQYFHEVRRSLHAMAGEPAHSRNWRPHLLVFSDQARRRAALVRFAAWVEGGAGLTTVVRILPGRDGSALHACREAERELADDLKANDLDAFALVITAGDLEQAGQTLIQSYGLGPIRANSILLNWLERRAPASDEGDDGGEDDEGNEGEGDQAWTERLFIRHIRQAAELGVNVIVLDASTADMVAVEAIPAEQRRIDVWFSDDATGRLQLLLAYMTTRSEEWADARIRLLMRIDRGTDAKVRARVAELLQEARIEAEIELFAEDVRARLIAASRDAALVLLPLKHKRFRTVDPFGKPIEGVLEQVGLAAMVSAVEDIQLDAEPEAEMEVEPAPVDDDAQESRATGDGAEQQQAAGGDAPAGAADAGQGADEDGGTPDGDAAPPDGTADEADDGAPPESPPSSGG